MQNELPIIKHILRKGLKENGVNTKMFFKTGKDSYAEHDQFIGISVPYIRSTAKKFKNLSLELVHILLQSAFNEERLLALFIIVLQYKKGDDKTQKRLYDFYLENIVYINNWNLIDSSAHLIIGRYLQDKDKSILSQLSQSVDWCQRRIAIIATWCFIKQGKLDSTFYIATLLLKDSHDLIHKAVGWMLREAGKKNEALLIQFLDIHAAHMPRTMVRYAIEKLDASIKQKYSLKTVSE